MKLVFRVHDLPNILCFLQLNLQNFNFFEIVFIMLDDHPDHIKQVRGTLFNFREEKWTASIQHVGGKLDAYPHNQLMTVFSESKVNEGVHYIDANLYNLKMVFMQKNVSHPDFEPFKFSVRICSQFSYKRGIEVHYFRVEHARRQAQTKQHRKKYIRDMVLKRFDNYIMNEVYKKMAEIKFVTPKYI